MTPDPRRAAWSAVKPWMEQRPGETALEQGNRLALTCYRCGWQAPTRLLVDMHEEVCDGESSAG